MSASEEVRAVIRDLQAAVAQSTGRIGELGMRVTELGVDLETVLEKKASGEIDLKLVKLGGGGGVKDTTTISLTMEPSDAVGAAYVDDELTNALAVIEAAIAVLDADYVLSEATVEVAFETTMEGKISLVLGGEASRAKTHTAKVTFKPDE